MSARLQSSTSEGMCHEAYHSETAFTTMTFSSGELKVKESGVSAGYGVRVLKGGRLGFSHCQGENDLAKALEKAGQLSRFSAKSGFCFAGKTRSGYPRPRAPDPKIDPTDYRSLREMVVDEAVEAAGRHGGMPRVVVSCELGTVQVSNSEGFRGTYGKSGFTSFIECMDGKGYGFAFSSTNSHPGSLRDAGLKAAEMAKEMRNARKPESGEYLVVMEPIVLSSMVDLLMPSFSGDWKRRGITKLDKAKGRRIFSEKLTLGDDGTADGTGARPFDDEGVPSMRRTMIEKGIVKDFLYDRETAALSGMGVEAAGACSRVSYDAVPGIGGSNTVISPGEWKDLEDLDRFMEVHSAHGSHTANTTTGEMGLEVSVAFLVQRGKRTPVRDFMLTGNLFDMFANIEAMEKEQKVCDDLVAPRIAFRGLKVVS